MKYVECTYYYWVITNLFAIYDAEGCEMLQFPQCSITATLHRFDNLTLKLFSSKQPQMLHVVTYLVAAN